MKIQNSLKPTLAAIAASLVLTSSAFAANTDFPAPLPGFKNDAELAEWRNDLIAKAEAEEAAALEARETSQVFYTGKPFMEETGEYAFLFRNYNPEFARWSSHDPSGFPDGANNLAYMAVPTTQFDWQGLETVTLSEFYSLTMESTFGWGHLALSATGGAAAGGGAGLAAGAVLTPPAWVLAAVGGVIGSVSGAVLGANIAYVDFQNTINLQYPSGLEGTAGQLYNTTTTEIEDPVLESTNSQFTGNEFDWNWTLSGIRFTATIKSQKDYTYE